MRAPVFIIGYPRSGTTLLRAMLGAHPSIDMVNEPELAYGLFTGGYTLGSAFPVEERTAVLEKLRAFKLSQNHLEKLPAAVLDAFRDQPKTMTFREVYEHLLFEGQPAQVWGEKSLNNSFLIPQLARLYPEALFVLIIRDARTTVFSNYRKTFVLYRAQAEVALSETPERETMHIFAHEAMKWVAWIEQVRAYGQRLRRGHFLEIRYEDLLAEPQRVLAALCDQIGLAWDAAMLAAERRRRDPVLAQPNAVIHQKIAEPLDASKVDEHAALPDWANDLVERYAAPLLTHYGYPLVRPRLSMGARVRREMVVRMAERRLRRRIARFMASRRFEDTEAPAALAQPVKGVA